MKSNVKQIRQFVSLFRFVKDYARLVAPLTRLTKKDYPWTWTEEQVVQRIKTIQTTGPVLINFDELLETELHTDARSLSLCKLKTVIAAW